MHGIYIIKNMKESKYYISSSVFADHRIFYHKKMLSERVHPNRELQSDYDRLGKDSFVFEIVYNNLEEIDVPLRESEYIEDLQSKSKVIIYKKRNNENQKNVKIDFDIHHQLKLISIKTGLSMAKLVEMGSLKVVNEFVDGEYDKLVTIQNEVRRDGSLKRN